MKDQTRNLNPHKPARAAMYLWGKRYATSGKGSMDFWDSLAPHEKQLCRDMVKDIEADRDELPRELPSERT